MPRSITKRWTLCGAAIGTVTTLALVVGLGVLAGAGAAASTTRPKNTKQPTITGTARPGQVLTGDRGNWSGNPTSYDYNWLRCDKNGNDCSKISGARNTTYTLTSGDVAHTIRFRVEAKNTDGSVTVSSDPTDVVTASTSQQPQNTSPPKISGTPRQGQTLTGDRGNWSGSPTDYNLFWLRCDRNGNSCSNIDGAAGHTTYVLTSADVGKTLRFKVGAKHGSSSYVFATSVPTAVIAAAGKPPRNQSAPTISGTPAVGRVLTMSVGNWAESPTGYLYRWLRCDRNGGACIAITGAVGRTWRVLPASVGHTIRARVTATNAAGATPATSAPTRVIAGAAPPPPPPAAGCPGGRGTVTVSGIGPPARLLIDRQKTNLSVVHRRTRELLIRYHVSACGGRSVQGALVYATAVPFNQLTIPAEQRTDANGWAKLRFRMLRGFPVSSKQGLIALFVRARKPGESVLGGISTRRLFSVRVNLNG